MREVAERCILLCDHDPAQARKASAMVGQLVRVTGAGYHAAFEALAENHGNMDAAVSALTCAPELPAATAADSTNFGARTELPALERGLAGDLVSPSAPDVTEPVPGDKGNGDGSNSSSASAASSGAAAGGGAADSSAGNAIPQGVLLALMDGVL